MTQEEKLKKAVKLADAMYYAAQQLTTDASHLKEAMEKWWQFKNVELKESEDERIRERLIEFFKDWGKTRSHCWSISISDILAWLEKQGKQPSAIRWYDVSLIPQEMEELLVEWDSEDATWHEIAFYHADTKTFWNGTRQVENVTRWCYIIDLLEKQGEQKPWSEEDEEHYNMCLQYFDVVNPDMVYYKDYQWLKSLKQRIAP